MRNLNKYSNNNSLYYDMFKIYDLQTWYKDNNDDGVHIELPSYFIEDLIIFSCRDCGVFSKIISDRICPICKKIFKVTI